MRYGILAAAMLWCAAGPASAQISIGIHIGSNPNLVAIPGYPVYYAPGLESNYFYFDGRYWVCQEDGWYSSPGYDGPWEFVDPMYVPIELLQVPVRYYRRPPAYFRSWQADRPPRWGEHWGQGWAQRRSGWDRPAQHERPAAPPPPQGQRRQEQGQQGQVQQDQHFQGQRPQGNDHSQKVDHPQYNGRPQSSNGHPGPGGSPAAETPRPQHNAPQRGGEQGDRPHSDRQQGNHTQGGAEQGAHRDDRKGEDHH